MMDNTDNIWCVIPVYNNARTIKDIVKKCCEILQNILVIDDGSTDANLSELLKNTGAIVISHKINRGKGAAILTALKFLEQKNALSMITIDGDGQHLPSDLKLFIEGIKAFPDALHIGIRNFNQTSIPGSSRFGRRFSNMWFKVETGQDCKDTQSGFRAYPVPLISKLKLFGSFYDFEIEVIARSAWAGIPINEIDISVVYEPLELRVSHFKKFRDNLRISLMHSRLIGRRLIPFPHKKLYKNKENLNFSLLLHPVEFFRLLLNENTSPLALALSAAIGTALAVLPIVGFHTIAIIYVTARLHLNKIMALSIQVLYSPPFVPFICIEAGHFLQNGSFITELTLSSFKANWQEFFLDWILGSLVLAPFYSLVAFVGVYYISLKIKKRITNKTYV